MREVASAQSGFTSAPRENTPSPREFQSPRDEEFYLQGDMADPDFVYRQCRAHVRRLVMIHQKEMLTKDAAIHWVAKTYKLRSFVRKMWNGERAEVRVWQWVRVMRALKKAEQMERLRDEHARRMAEEMAAAGLQ